ncbi:MAG: SRPBCC family protein [Chitinophagales bacterium]|nr:SRPBCC family protein [Chitinophagales bacterium]
MEKIHILQDFDAPIHNVFAFISNHNRWNEIFPAAYLRRVINSPDPKNINGVGSTRIVATFPFPFFETITQYQEDKYLEYKISSPSILKNHIGKMNFIALSDRKCRLDYTIEFDGVIPFSSFIIRNILEKEVGNGIRDLALKFKRNPNYY